MLALSKNPAVKDVILDRDIPNCSCRRPSKGIWLVWLGRIHGHPVIEHRLRHSHLSLTILTVLLIALPRLNGIDKRFLTVKLMIRSTSNRAE